MKIKLIQMATLLVFVMSVVYMAQIPNGYGHDAGDHDPNFHIDVCGYRKVSGTIDPRGRMFNTTICGTDGDGYVYERGWYYRGSGELGGKHIPAAPEQVYRLNLSGEATANESKPQADYLPVLTI